MEPILEGFIKEYPDILNSNDDEIIDNLRNYLYKIYLCSYINKTIKFSSFNIKNKILYVKAIEKLSLNATDSHFNEEKINLIDQKVDFQENLICKDLKEFSDNINISNAIGFLTKKQKEVIYFCIVENMSDTQTANLLGVTKQCVNKHKKNALSKIRKKLLRDTI